MKRWNPMIWAMAALLALVMTPTALAIGGPDLGEGQLAELDHGRSEVYWNVFAEHERVTLTVSTPCGVIERSYDSGENPYFSIDELKPDDPRGSYTWQIRIDPKVDPGVRKELDRARLEGDDETVRALRRKGLLPQGPFIQTGSFSVDEGGILELTEEEGKQEISGKTSAGDNGLGLVTGESINLITEEAQIISPDGVVYNSLCVGFDCPTSPSFGADTIRLQENNLRIHADDTSTAGGFPNQDWRLEFNSNLNGGAEYFRVIDVTANRNIMTLEANAPSNALVVDSGGRVGLGTANPVVELHVASGDTPALRLDQTTASGFAAQVWDVAGNETSFFVRDATNGSTLPFRIRPGASSNSLVIDSDGDIGVGILTTGTMTNGGDQAAVHIRRTATDDSGLLVERASTSPASDVLMEIRNNGTPRFDMVDTNSGSEWRFEASASGFNINDLADAGTAELVLATNGDLTIEGDLTANGTNYPSSRTLKQGFAAIDNREVLQRLSRVPVSVWTYKTDADQRPHIGPVTEDFSAAFDFLEVDGKLNTIDLHGVAMAAIQGLNDMVAEQNGQLAAKDAQIVDLEERLAAIEARLAETAEGSVD